ncbi:MAG: hypothetical protein NVS3B20_19090 [Polyangiales bacterium]
MRVTVNLAAMLWFLRRAISSETIACIGCLGAVAVTVACSSGSLGQAGGVDDASAEDAPAVDGSADSNDVGSAEVASEVSAASVSCDRSHQARVAKASLFDGLTKDLASAADSEKAARIETFLKAVEADGGTPLEDGSRVIIIAKGAPKDGVAWRVSGSFNGWDAMGIVLTPVASTDLYAVELTLPSSMAAQYKLIVTHADGTSTLREDPRAHHVVWDGISRDGVGEFNAVIHPGAQDPSKGRIEAFRALKPVMLPAPRDVFVYLPAQYDDPSCAVLPLLVAHDGNEALTHTSQAYVADTTYAETKSASSVIAFVALANQGDRLSEYTHFPDPSGKLIVTGAKYASFLENELSELLQSHYRLCTKPVDRGTLGISRGGLVASDLALRNPAKWGFVGSQSGAFWWADNAAVKEVNMLPSKLPVRMYLDTGCPDDNCDSVTAMNAALAAKGFEHSFVVEPGGTHDWEHWGKRLPGLLRYFREGRGPNKDTPGCTP